MNDFETINLNINGQEIEAIMTKENNAFFFSTHSISLIFNKTKETIRKAFNRLMTSQENEEKASIDSTVDSATVSGVVSGVLSGIGDNEKKRLIKYYKADLIYEYARRINSNIGEILKAKIDEFLNNESIEKMNNIIIYNNGNISLSVNISPKEETVWLTVNQIASLYETTVKNVYKHIDNIFKEGELVNPTVNEKWKVQTYVKTISLTLKEGDREVIRNIEHYNLDVILAVGYRVKSKRAMEFRSWASKTLIQFMKQGYVIDEKRTLSYQENILKLESDVINLQKEVNELKANVLISDNGEKLFFDGEIFDAKEYLASIFTKAKESLIIIDPYFDIIGLSLMRKIESNVQITIVTSNNAPLGKHDRRAFSNQYRPFSIIRMNNIHDRFAFIDEKECYSLGTSLNYAGRRLFMINRISDEEIILAILGTIKKKLDENT